MSRTYLNDLDFVTTMQRLKGFRPVEGTSARAMVETDPGLGFRVTYFIAATDEDMVSYEITEPPTSETLDALYLESMRLLNMAWDSTVGAPPETSRLTLGGMTFEGVGYDS